MEQYAGAKGVPAPEQAVQATGCDAAGRRPQRDRRASSRGRGLAAIIGFLMPVTLQMHRFWEEQDTRSARAR